MLARIDARQDNDWGCVGDTREYLRRFLPGYRARLRGSGAILIDAGSPSTRWWTRYSPTRWLTRPRAKPASRAISPAPDPGNRQASPEDDAMVTRKTVIVPDGQIGYACGQQHRPNTLRDCWHSRARPVARSPRAGKPGLSGRLPGRQAERFGMGPAVVLGQDLGEAAWPVCDGAAADLAARGRQLGDGHREPARGLPSLDPVTGRFCAQDESARNAGGTPGCGTADGAARRIRDTQTGSPPVPAGRGCRHLACGAPAEPEASAALARPVRTRNAGTRVRTLRTGSLAPRPALCHAAAVRPADCPMRSYVHGRTAVSPVGTTR